MSFPASIAKENKTVLLVEPNTQARNRLSDILCGAGYRVLAAADTEAALRIVNSDGCDLVVLDLAMPELDGLALCQLLRAQPSTASLPIVLLSDDDLDSRMAEVFAAGADDYLSMNSTPAELTTRVAAHLRAAQKESQLLRSNRELRFLSDLGRGLLRALEPDQLVRRVAGATYEGTNATLSATVLAFQSGGVVGCAFDREGSAEDESLLKVSKLRLWLKNSDSTAAQLITKSSDFFLNDKRHKLEYAVPLRFGGQTTGALVVAFDKAEDCGETEQRLLDAAAQQTALAAHICALYQAARQTSSSLAREVDRTSAEADSQRRFIEAIIDSLPVSLYVIDNSYRIVAWNRNRELGELGVPRGSVLGKNIFKVLTRQKKELLQNEFTRVFETGKMQFIEQETTAMNGEAKHWRISKIPMKIDSSGNVSHVITVGEDVTARVEANRAVARADKLSAIGRLAAGVVHEINNPLATISACAEALESRVREGGFAGAAALEDLREYLALIRSEAFRCKSITNGLLDFSRSRSSKYVLTNLDEVIASAVRLLSHQQQSGNISFHTKSNGNLPPILGDPSQLQQALIALATNAVDAMPDGGTVTISSHSSGNQVLVAVNDTGSGISPENISKIFEPFFTTKEVGRGTGLGLAVCYGILTEHGGTLDVQSTLGEGTTFTISLPAVNSEEA